MKVPIRSLLLFNLNLPRDFFFFNYYETKDICCRVGRKNFQMSKTFPRLDQGAEAFRIARTVGCEMQTSENFTRVNVMPPWRTLCNKQETFSSSMVYLASRDNRTTQSPALCGNMQMNPNSCKHLPSMVRISVSSLGVSNGHLNNKFVILTNRIVNENLLVGRDIYF